VHGEKRIVSFLDIALPVMYKACMDEEKVVSKNVRFRIILVTERGQLNH
jgi:hypothetical protein